MYAQNPRQQAPQTAYEALNQHAAKQSMIELGVGTGMGGMGMVGMNVGTPTIMNGTYMFIGPCMPFEAKVPEVATDPQASTIKDAHLTIFGNQAYAGNPGLVVCTLIWGLCLIFPLFFMCCQWWKKKANPAAVVPISAYRALQNLIRLPQVQSLTLMVTDNGFGQEKADFLYNMISTSQLKSFRFTNMVQYFDHEDEEYSRFGERMKPFKSLPMTTEIRWQYEAVK